MRQRRIKIAAAALCCASLVLVAGCGSTPPTPNASATPEASSPTPPEGLSADALAAWTRWQTQGLSQYSYDLSVGCFCALQPHAHVVIANDVVNVDAPKNEYRMIRSVVGDEPLTVEGLFAWIASAQQRADRVTVKFDDATGFPKSITVDYALNASDDEMYVTTNDLQT